MLPPANGAPNSTLSLPDSIKSALSDLVDLCYLYRYFNYFRLKSYRKVIYHMHVILCQNLKSVSPYVFKLLSLVVHLPIKKKVNFGLPIASKIVFCFTKPKLFRQNGGGNSLIAEVECFQFFSLAG